MSATTISPRATAPRIGEEVSYSMPAVGRLAVATQRRIPKPINRKKRC
jgi:hypothetical protein